MTDQISSISYLHILPNLTSLNIYRIIKQTNATFILLHQQQQYQFCKFLDAIKPKYFNTPLPSRSVFTWFLVNERGNLRNLLRTRTFPNIRSSTEHERFIPTIKKVRWHCIVGLFCWVKPIWRPVFQLLPQCREWRIIHNKPLCFSDLNSNSHHMEWRWVSGLLIALILC